MSGVPVLVLAATVGVSYGWVPDEKDGVEYIIQVAPERVDDLQRSGSVSSSIPESVRGHVSKVTIRVGHGDVPRRTPLGLHQPGAGLRSAVNAVSDSDAIALKPSETRSGPPIDQSGQRRLKPNPQGGFHIPADMGQSHNGMGQQGSPSGPSLFTQPGTGGPSTARVAPPSPGGSAGSGIPTRPSTQPRTANTSPFARNNDWRPGDLSPHGGQRQAGDESLADRRGGMTESGMIGNGFRGTSASAASSRREGQATENSGMADSRGNDLATGTDSYAERRRRDPEFQVDVPDPRRNDSRLDGNRTDGLTSDSSWPVDNALTRVGQAGEQAFRQLRESVQQLWRDLQDEDYRWLSDNGWTPETYQEFALRGGRFFKGVLPVDANNAPINADFKPVADTVSASDVSRFANYPETVATRDQAMDSPDRFPRNDHTNFGDNGGRSRDTRTDAFPVNFDRDGATRSPRLDDRDPRITADTAWPRRTSPADTLGSGDDQVNDRLAYIAARDELARREQEVRDREFRLRQEALRLESVKRQPLAEPTVNAEPNEPAVTSASDLRRSERPQQRPSRSLSDSEFEGRFTDTSDRPAREAKAVAAQPLFNSMLLLSIVGNVWLALWLKSLRDQFRDMVASKRAASSTVSVG